MQKQEISSSKNNGNRIKLGHYCFTVDSASMTEVTYSTLVDALTMVATKTTALQNGDGHHNHFITFSGCNLNENSLKDWLRACAKQVCYTFYSQIKKYFHFCFRTRKTSLTNDAVNIIFKLFHSSNYISQTWNFLVNKYETPVISVYFVFLTGSREETKINEEGFEKRRN